MKNSLNISKLRLGVVMWLFGMIGIFSILLILPSMLIDKTLSIPMWAILLIQLVQSSIILAVAVWIGVVLSPKINLHSPCLEAIVSKNWLSAIKSFRLQLIPGCIGGVAVGALLIGMSYITPHELTDNTQHINPILQILTGALYGGITEEILLRWGMMTLLTWLLWRFCQRNQNNPSRIIVWIAIVGSALLFAFGHLPAAQILAHHITFNIFTYIIVGNTLAGIVFGFLYQRFGLESAILAHTLAHIFSGPLMLVVH